MVGAMLPMYPLVGHCRLCPLFCSVGDPSVDRGYAPPPPPTEGRGYVANPPTYGPLLSLSPSMRCWGRPYGRGYLSHVPTCGPLLTLSPLVKCWGPLGRWRLCSQFAHLWANLGFVPGFEVLHTPHTVAVM